MYPLTQDSDQALGTPEIPHPGRLTARLVVLAAAGMVLAACAVQGPGTPAEGGTMARPVVGAELEVYLEPYDDKGICSVTVRITNRAAADMGVAWLDLAWRASDGQELERVRQRLDPVRAGYSDAKNHTLQLPCARVDQLHVVGAEWSLEQPGPASQEETRVSMTGVAGTLWRFAWNPDWSLFVGQPVLPQGPATGG